MNKNILAASIALSLGAFAPTANAAFTSLSAGNYTLDITGGCFAFGDCTSVGTDPTDVNGAGDFSAMTAGQASTTVPGPGGVRAAGSTVGSGSLTAGDYGTITFSLDSTGNMTINSYAQTSYLATTGGTFFVDALGSAGVSQMGGSIDGSGNVAFDPTGREGMAGNFATGIGVQPWNDSKKTGVYDQFTTGSVTNQAKGGSAAFTMTGTALTDDGTGGWMGTIVSTGNINGDNWTGFSNVQFSEVFDVSITCSDAAGTGCNAPAIPVPAAVWLFGSGLLGLVGVARRRKSA